MQDTAQGKDDRVAALTSNENGEILASAEEDGDRRKRGIIAVVALVVLFLLLLWWLLARYAAVPDVTGLSEQRATEVLEEAGFTVGEVFEGAELEGRPGAVSSQSPGGGARALLGSAIDLFIPPGVPGVADVETERRPGIDDLGITWGQPTSAPRPIQPAGSTDGRPRVPQALGLTETDGVALLRRAGYQVNVDYGPSSTAVRRGYIFYQDPAPDTVVPRGTTVSIFVSIGSPTPGAAVRIPDQPRH